MKLSKRHRSFLVGVTVGALVLGACGSDAKVVETNDGKVTVGKDDQVSIEGENGTQVTFGGAKVPDGFPGAVPLPKGLKLVSSAGAPQSYTLGYTFGAAKGVRVIARYLTRLRNAGLSTTGDTGANPFASGGAEGKGWKVVATVMSPKLLTVVVTST